MTYRETVSAYNPQTDNSPPSPTPDEECLAGLPQVPETEIDVPQVIIIGTLRGSVFNRQYRREIRDCFPRIKLLITNRQTRFVVLYHEDDPHPTIEPWQLNKHGEFADLPELPATPAELQQYLKEVGILNEENNLLTSQQIRNARKKRASTRIFLQYH